MKSTLNFTMTILFIFALISSKVNAFEAKSIINKSQIIIADKFAERFCSAKADHFFDGLDNEKTLKYSYFKYIGLQSGDKFSKDMYQPLINKINEKCLITSDEEKEINELFFMKS